MLKPAMYHVYFSRTHSGPCCTSTSSATMPGGSTRAEATTNVMVRWYDWFFAVRTTRGWASAAASDSASQAAQSRGLLQGPSSALVRIAAAAAPITPATYSRALRGMLAKLVLVRVIVLLHPDQGR